MAGYLLDTNHLSSAIRKTSALRERIREAHRAGNRFATSWPALCELEAGICQTARADTYGRTLRALLKEVRIWGVDRAKKAGRVLSHVDLVLFAIPDGLDFRPACQSC